MDKRSWLLLLFFSILISVVPLSTYAQADSMDREQVFEFLGEAFEAQVSLSEQGRTMDEIEGILEPYFTEDYKSLFIKENVVGQENQYQTYGTDFAPYYIPFYAFSEKTKVVDMKDEIYVLEYFPGNGEGPVSYDSHYEGLKIVKEKSGWKVADYMYEKIPEEVINKAYPEKAKKKEVSKVNLDKKQTANTLVFGPNFSSFKTFMELGVMFGNESKTLLFGLL
ncbi:DUF3993 domain-containing protein [Bacillus sp. JJ1609]|uniref:DUF3993 domain-containing protein n=1 Tax=Bacillus sp. JJ1609 TaxID=3122977 RepID=UPI002FFE1188